MNLTTEFLQLQCQVLPGKTCTWLRRDQTKNRILNFCVLVCVCVDMGKFILFICGFHWYFHQKGQCFEAEGWLCSLRTGGDSRMQLYY